MITLFTTDPDDGCYQVDGAWCRPVHNHEVEPLLAKGWSKTPNIEVADKPKAKSMVEQALELGIEVEQDGKPVHHKTLAKLIKDANEK